ncbi:MAG TPA: ABC transporter substrate-binding protein [Bacillota bacterium]
MTAIHSRLRGKGWARTLSVLIACILLLTLVLSGCSGAKTAKRENVLVIAGDTDLDTALWTQSGLFLIDQLLTIMGEPLVYVQPDGTVQPALADSYEMSTDGMVYTFHLNPKAKWQDGQPVTAKDVAFTIEQTILPDTPSGGGPSLLLKGADEFATGKAKSVSGVEIVNDQTIKLTFAEKSGQVLAILAADAILPYHLLGNVASNKMVDDPFNTKPIYCGPYKLTSWTKGSEIVFERFADFFGPKPAFDKIIYRIIPEPATAIAELKAGKVDVVMNVPVDDYAGLTADANFKGVQTKGPYGRHLMINQNKPEWKDLKVRQALTYAFDWKGVLDGLYKGKGTLSTSLFHPDNWEYNKNLQPYEYNPDKAKQLLAEAGWKDTNNDGVVEAHGVKGVKDGQKLTVVFPVTKKLQEDISLVLKDQLAKIGISATVQNYEASAFYADVYTKGGTKWDLIMMQWGNSFVGAWPSSRAVEFNFGGVGTTQHKREGWDDKALAAKIDEVMRTPDQAKAKPIWDDIQKTIYDNVYRIHAFREDAYIVYNAKLNVDASQPIWDMMWLKLSRGAGWSDLK